MGGADGVASFIVTTETRSKNEVFRIKVLTYLQFQPIITVAHPPCVEGVPAPCPLRGTALAVS